MASPIILWDIMDTLVRDPFHTHMPAFFGYSMDALLQRLRPKNWVEFELGQLEESLFYERFFRDGTPIDGPGLKRCMGEAYAWIEGVEDLLGELKQRGARMHALSNYPPWYQLVEQRLGLSRYIELSFISCHTGVRKPASEAFLGPCRVLGVEPAQAVFIDDRVSNCDAARALGLTALQFQGSPEALRAQLVELGLL